MERISISLSSIDSDNSDRVFNYSKEEWAKIKEIDKLLGSEV